MKAIILTAILCWFSCTAHAQQKPSFTDTEAASHVGEEATVTGKVFTVSTSSKGTTFLNFGDRFPRHTFSGIVFARNQDAVGDVKQFEGKIVSLSGRIEMSPDQKPQIIINTLDQLKLAGSAPPTTPAAPPPTPAAAAPMTPPGTPSPTVETRPVEPAKRITLSTNWSSPPQGGEMTRKDLAKLFGASGSAGEITTVTTPIEVYPGVPFLAPLAFAKKSLNLDSAPSTKARIVSAGLPQGSFSATVYAGVFPGGFDRLYLICDTADQVVSVLAVESNTRSRVTNEPDSNGYHTYNFVAGRVKATNDIVIRHQIDREGAPEGVIVVNSMLIDPNDPETPAPVRSSKGGSSKSSSSKSAYTRQKTGKVLERSRWYVPEPIVNLILRCSVQ